MKTKCEHIAAGLIFAFFIGAIYLSNCYTEIFSFRRAYLYIPNTDDIFSLELTYEIDFSNRWDVFNPFKTIPRTNPKNLTYIGKLTASLERFSRQIELLTKDPEKWSQMIRAENEDALRRFRAQQDDSTRGEDKILTRSATTPFIFFVDNGGARSMKNLSDTGREILLSANVTSDDIRIVDVLFGSYDSSVDLDPTTVTVKSRSDVFKVNELHDVLLFTGNAAQAIRERGVVSPLPDVGEWKELRLKSR